MKLSVNIEVQNDNHSECGKNCVFLADNFCLLFSKDLIGIGLSQGFYEKIPTNKRCYKCLLMEE